MAKGQSIVHYAGANVTQADMLIHRSAGTARMMNAVVSSLTYRTPTKKTLNRLAGTPEAALCSRSHAAALQENVWIRPPSLE